MRITKVVTIELLNILLRIRQKQWKQVAGPDNPLRHEIVSEEQTWCWACGLDWFSWLDSNATCSTRKRTDEQLGKLVG